MIYHTAVWKKLDSFRMNILFTIPLGRSWGPAFLFALRESVIKLETICLKLYHPIFVGGVKFIFDSTLILKDKFTN